MDPATFSVRVTAPDGAVAMREGLVLVLYLRQPHVAIAGAVADLLKAYEDWVGPGALKWIHDRGEYFRAYSARGRLRLHESLRSTQADGKNDDHFTLKGNGPESDVGAFTFQYSGRDMRGRLAAVNASSVELWLPLEFCRDRTWPVVTQALLELGDLVPFSSGYASIALHREEWAAISTDAQARALILRHPGLDLNDTTNTAIRIGDDVRGAYWLTLLSNQVLERLEHSAASLGEQLGPEITVHELRHGVAIQAGEVPQCGDVDVQDRLPLVRRVAALIEPVQHIQRVAIFGFRALEDFEAWQRRHL